MSTACPEAGQQMCEKKSIQAYPAWHSKPRYRPLSIPAPTLATMHWAVPVASADAFAAWPYSTASAAMHLATLETAPPTSAVFGATTAASESSLLLLLRAQAPSRSGPALLLLRLSMQPPWRLRLAPLLFPRVPLPMRLSAKLLPLPWRVQLYLRQSLSSSAFIASASAFEIEPSTAAVVEIAATLKPSLAFPQLLSLAHCHAHSSAPFPPCFMPPRPHHAHIHPPCRWI